MKITSEITTFAQLYERSWAGAKEVLDEIAQAGIEEEAFDFIESLLEEDSIDDVHLNDLIWFDLLDMLEEAGIYKPED